MVTVPIAPFEMVNYIHPHIYIPHRYTMARHYCTPHSLSQETVSNLNGLASQYLQKMTEYEAK
jgi:hypothetical protein